MRTAITFLARLLRTPEGLDNHDRLTGPDLAQLEPELAHETARR